MSVLHFHISHYSPKRTTQGTARDAVVHKHSAKEHWVTDQESQSLFKFLQPFWFRQEKQPSFEASMSLTSNTC